jgi:hypothetical protein
VSPSCETGERSADEVLRLIERGDDAMRKCGFREVRNTSRGRECEAPCGADERLQRVQDVTENGVGEVRGLQEGEGCKECGPARIQHRAYSSKPSQGWLGFEQRSRVEWARCTHGLG